MKLLVIGGTQFVGRHLIEAALSAGHTVTAFNRGRTNANLFPDIETIVGDRAFDLERLRDGQWDAVIDTCGYLPKSLEISTKALLDRCGTYVFVSSVSVYADFRQQRIDESSAVQSLRDPESENIAEDYGALKAACERVVDRAFPGRSLVIRPGIIAGPHDPTDRFTYWLFKVATRDRVLVPNGKASPLQFVDVRDLSEWTVRMIEEGVTGVYNVAGPLDSLDFQAFVETLKAVLNPGCRLVEVSESFLNERGVSTWAEQPLWIGPTNKDVSGLFRIDSRRALQKGLRFRSLENTILDTARWFRSLGVAFSPKVGLDAERENALIEAYLAGD